jgi:hypothetical protein
MNPAAAFFLSLPDSHVSNWHIFPQAFANIAAKIVPMLGRSRRFAD